MCCMDHLSTILPNFHCHWLRSFQTRIFLSDLHMGSNYKINRLWLVMAILFDRCFLKNLTYFVENPLRTIPSKFGSHRLFRPLSQNFCATIVQQSITEFGFWTSCLKQWVFCCICKLSVKYLSTSRVKTNTDGF